VKNPVTPLNNVAKRLEDDALIKSALVAKRFVLVLLSVVSAVIVVVASVEVPLTRSVPLAEIFP
jgi:hypothetical protein